MKNSNLSEVSTIFHKKKSQESVKLSYCDEKSNIEILSATRKNSSSTDGIHHCDFIADCGDCTNSCRAIESNVGCALGNTGHTTPTNSVITGCSTNAGQCRVQSQSIYQFRSDSSHSFPCQESLSTFCESCCAASAKKIYFGICVTVCVTASWVGTTHCIKFLYHQSGESVVSSNSSSNSSHPTIINRQIVVSYDAPFITTWFSTNWTILYFPLYFVSQLIRTKCSSPSQIISESLRGFRDKGLSIGRFLTRCSMFCGLWVATNYMYIHSLKILLATDVMTLFATNVACVYLLSWVILHEQFVGVRIVAVILCDTGIALLAYMDGITGSPTLGGVVLAASAAAGSAVYKVLFKKVIGDTTFGQISLFFSIVGICNASLLWPICLVLYFSGVEQVPWENFPWVVLLSASVLHLTANMLGNFSIAVTYNLFITLGLITAVPVSAALDVILYGANFVGMKLAGMILIATGFFLVMFPNNWPDYFTRLLRWSRRHRHGISGGTSRDIVDYRTGYIKSHLRSPSGRVR